MLRPPALAPFFRAVGLAALCGFGISVQPSGAMVLPDALVEAINQATEEFVGAPGYTEIDDPSALSNEDWYSEARFPGMSDGSSVFWPDAAMPPIQKALMMVDHYEGALPHVRYQVRARSEFVWSEDHMAPPLALVEITRFNLGPLRRDDLRHSVDDAHLAPASVFGVGPHVSWRFVMSSIQGQLANIDAAVRREVDPDSAAAATCFGQPCLTLDDITGLSEDDWQDADLPEDDAASVQAEAGEVARLLAATALPDGYGEPVEGLADGDFPVQIVISKDVTGQEAMTTGVLHHSHLMDDAVSDIWTRRLQIGDLIQWQESVVYRPGRS